MLPTILIVDDHAGFRRSARMLLAAEGFDVVGDVADGSSALAAVRRLHPQIVLLDVQLPDIDGFIVADELRAADPALAIILISSRDRTSYRPQLEHTPATGFIPKNRLDGAAIRELIR
jgi:two-component system, NarL family, nitrate/nitrite response regulator NarL